jgi:hypothetical protein
VRRRLKRRALKPRRVHSWCSAGARPDPELRAKTAGVADLFSRQLAPHEAALSLDEKTGLQPRPRPSASRPAAPGEPCRFNDRYRRAGAVNLFAALDMRTGRVHVRTSARKKADDFIAFLEELDAAIPADKTVVHAVLDDINIHKGPKVKAWLEAHPRFRFRFTPVRCSWMNQVEQWFSILQRKRLRLIDFPDADALAARLRAFAEEWNRRAHPFLWTPRTAAKLIAWADRKAAG